ncbi:acetyl-CoA carboxylase biotin carboxylase subunit family protein [Streptosporangium algeriense]|uniref:Acetyl-CoA carboxylase biotin carboxylase subunit family protein n=1 Tax=Streptosporangium algeriense TaxID=1682748 RepID=A0ABW3DR30_9ACTN
MTREDGRRHVLIVDRAGYDRYRMPDGGPVVDPGSYDVTLITRPEVAGQPRRGECERVLAFDIDDERMTTDVATLVHGHAALDAIVVFPENLLLPVAELRDRLGVPGQGEEQVRPFRDKPSMKRVAERGGLRVVDWAAPDSADEARDFLARHGKIVLKPRDGAGSAGIHVVASADELDRVLATEGFEISRYQAERFVDLPMIHVDAVILDGQPLVSVTSHYLSSTLSHLNLLPLMSAAVEDPVLLARAEKLLADVVTAFSVKDAVLHLEAFDPEEPELVFNEVACRAGGGGVVPVVQSLTGYNLFEAMVRMALGEQPTSTYEVTARCSGFLLLYGPAGVVEEVDDSAVPKDWIVERKTAVRPGEAHRPVGRAGGGLVSYVVRGENQAEVEHRLRTVADTVRIRYRDERSV